MSENRVGAFADDKAIDELRRRGGVCIPDVVADETLALLEDAILRSERLSQSDNGDGYAIGTGVAGERQDIQDFLHHGLPARLAREILGPTAEFYTERVFWVRAKSAATTYWHQDAVLTNLSEARSLCVIWIPLGDVTEDDAPLVFQPGSHLRREPTFSQSLVSNIRAFEARQGYSPRIISDGFDSVSDAETLTARRGDVVVLDGWTLHCSRPNLSDRNRCAFALRYRIPHGSEH